MAYMRVKEMTSYLGHRSAASVYQAIEAGLFPKSLPVNEKERGWPKSEVDLIQAARIAGKSADEIRELVKRIYAQRLKTFGTFGDK